MSVCENATLRVCACGKCCLECNRSFGNVGFVSSFVWAQISCFQDVETCKDVKRFSVLSFAPHFTSSPYPPQPARPKVTQVTGFLLLLWAPWFLCSTLRALPRSPKKKEREENRDNHFRATKEVGEACLVSSVSPLGIYMHTFVPLTLSNLEKCLCLLHVLLATFVFWTKVFSFIWRWWVGWGGEKIGNRATHSGSESARHLVVCWLWKWQGLGGVVLVLWGTDEIVRKFVHIFCWGSQNSCKVGAAMCTVQQALKERRRD